MSQKRKSTGCEEAASEKKICIEKTEAISSSDVKNDDSNEVTSDCSSELSENHDNGINAEEIRNNLVKLAESIRIAFYYTTTNKKNFVAQLNEINFIPNFFQFFIDEERNLSIEELTICFSIVVGLISLDDFRTLLKVFTNSNARSLFACLEYDPLESKQQNHRDFLNRMNFKAAISFNDASLKDLIRNTKQVTYIFEATLQNQHYARVKTILKDFLTTHKALIVEQIFLNHSQFDQLLDTLSDPAVSNDQRLDMLNFLQELIDMMRDNRVGTDPYVFYKVLLDKNILVGLIESMKSGDTNNRKLAATVLCKLAEKSPKNLQDFLNRQTRRIIRGIENGQLIIELLIHCLFNDDLSDITFTLLYFFELVFDPASTTYDFDMFGIVFNDTLRFVQSKVDEKNLEPFDYFGPLEAAIKLIVFFVQNHSGLLKVSNLLPPLVSTTIVLIMSDLNLLTAEGLHILKFLIEVNDVHVTALMLKFNVLKMIVERFDEARENFIKMKIRSIFGVIMQSRNCTMRLHYQEVYGSRFAEIKIPGIVLEQKCSSFPWVPPPGAEVTRSVMQTNELKKTAKLRLTY